jgi:site-specific DNA recombinase
MTEPFDTSNASGRFLLTVLAGVADLERSNILQRMDMGATRAAKAGKWLGGIVPYGYFKNDEGYLEINNAEIPGMGLSEPEVVRLMYNMCADKGNTSMQIADHLNALGIPPAWVAHGLGGKRRNNTRGVWTPGRIRHILRASTYMGIHRYGKRSRDRETISRPVPAIVDEAIWNKAQAVLKSNQIDAFRNAKHQYLLKSIVKCELCGSTYRGNPPWKNSTDGYYSCGGRSNWRQRSLPEKCMGMSINMRWLDDFVWNDCLKFINNPGLVVESIDAAQEDAGANILDAELLEGRLQELDADKERMLDLYRQKLISISDLTAQLDKIEKDRQAVTSELAEVKAKQSSDIFFGMKESAVNMLKLLQQAVNAPDVSFDTKKTVIRTMIEKITIATDNSGAHPRARITLHYKFHSDTAADFTRTVDRRDNRADNCAGIVTTMADYPPAPSPGTTQQERIIYLQFRENVSQPEMAAIGNVSTATISHIVNGRSESLCAASVKTISDYFGLPYYFVGAYDQLPEGTIGEQLRKGRLYRLMSINDAALFFGVSYKTYHKWEHGHIGSSDKAKAPDQDKLAEWIAVFAQNKLSGNLVPCAR